MLRIIWFPIRADIETMEASRYSNDYVVYFRKGTRIDYEHLRNIDLWGYQIINIQLDEQGRIRMTLRKVRTALT
ncbi:hypothetical protein [Candidatus Nitrosocosmicus sp. R]